jgi:hypothetical protein
VLEWEVAVVEAPNEQGQAAVPVLLEAMSAAQLVREPEVGPRLPTSKGTHRIYRTSLQGDSDSHTWGRPTLLYHLPTWQG